MHKPILLLLLLSSLLPACQTDISGSSLGSIPGVASTDGVVISFGAREEQRAFYEPLISTFHAANPGIIVRFVALDSELQAENRGLAVATAVDTALVDASIQEDLARGYATDLTPLLDGDASGMRADFSPLALSSATHNGRLFALPRTMQIPLLVYNQDLWTAHNVSLPTPDWKFTDLLSAAEQLTQANGDTVDVYGWADHTSALLTLFELLAETGANLLTTPPGELQVDTPEAVAALERMAQLLRGGVLASESLTGEPVDAFTLAPAGKVAIWNLIPNQVAVSARVWYADGGYSQKRRRGKHMYKPMPEIRESAEELRVLMKHERNPTAHQRLHALYVVSSEQARSRSAVARLLGVNRDYRVL